MEKRAVRSSRRRSLKERKKIKLPPVLVKKKKVLGCPHAEAKQVDAFIALLVNFLILFILPRLVINGRDYFVPWIWGFVTSVAVSGEDGWGAVEPGGSARRQGRGSHLLMADRLHLRPPRYGF